MSRILAGIVLFNPEIDRLCDEIKSIVSQVDFVYLYDNGSANIEEIRRALIEYENKVALVEGKKNHGIGFALNAICEYAYERHYEWVLTLDHDTICPEKIIENYKKYLNLEKTGMLCPRVIDKELITNPWESKNHTRNIERVERCIQSGALINTLTWKNVNGFDEKMFIDFVDFEYCKRLSVNGYFIYRCNDIVIDHELGKRENTAFSDFWLKLYEKTKFKYFYILSYKNVFSNIRVYYCSRNNIIYIRRYWNDINRKKEICDYLSRILRKILRSKKRLMVIFESLRGLKDGIKLSKGEIK